MKKYTETYTDDRIIYWPSFVGGVGFLCLCGFALLIYLLCAILMLCDGNVADGTLWGMGIAVILLGLWLIFAIRTAIRYMFCCITITKEGFTIDNKATAKHTSILWKQVSGIAFQREEYRGRERYRVYFETEADYIDIPVSMVDKKKLNALIPSELVKETSTTYFWK